MRRSVSALITSGVLLVFTFPASSGGQAIACYEPRQVSPLHGMVNETVVVDAARHSVEILPAKYGMATRQVLLEPESVRYLVTPAEYAMVAKTVLIHPAQTLRHATAPVYGVVEATVLIEAARETWVWKTIDGRKVYCKVVTPARYGREMRRVLVEPARAWLSVTPAEYGTQHVKVQIAPERHQAVVTPARYRSVRERVLLEPERRVIRTLPARYETRQRRVKPSMGQKAWSRVHLRGC